MQKFYGVIQGHCGHDYLYLFTEQQIKKEFHKNNLPKEFLPVSNNETVHLNLGWPNNGRYSSDTELVFLEGENKALEFLQQDAYGPRTKNPTLIDIAEYVWCIDTTIGCAAKILKKNELDPEDYTQYDERFDEILDRYNLQPLDFYEDYADLPYSDLDKEFSIEMEEEKE